MKPVGGFAVKLEALHHDCHAKNVFVDLLLAFLAGCAVALRVFRLKREIRFVWHRADCLQSVFLSKVYLRQNEVIREAKGHIIA